MHYLIIHMKAKSSKSTEKLNKTEPTIKLTYEEETKKILYIPSL